MKSVTHNWCDARPPVTFPAAERHRPLTGAKLYCLVTGAQGRSKNLPGSIYAVAPRSEVETATSWWQFRLLRHCTASIMWSLRAARWLRPFFLTPVKGRCTRSC